MFYYSPDYRSWQIFDSTKIINGLPCKYANTKSRSGGILCDIWFYPEIPMPVAFHSLINVPGLIVEANYYNTKESFTLINFEQEVPINPNIFWPRLFNEPFKKIKDAKKN